MKTATRSTNGIASEPRLTQSPIRAAIYTRKSTEEGLEQEYNSLDAQREAAESYISSQRHEGWIALQDRYDDGGFTGGNLDRPALKRLLQDIEAGKIDIIVCYKVDRLSRSLLDFSKLIEILDRHNVSFVSVTQNFQTTTSMGRLTLNILLSFAQFERELIGERVRDKIAGAKRKGKYTGGPPLLGYDVDSDNHKLILNPNEAKTVRHIFKRYTQVSSGLTIARELNELGTTRKSWTTKKGIFHPGKPWNTKQIYEILNNRTYLGETKHKDKTYPGEHEAIIPQTLWDSVHALIEHNPSGRRRRDVIPALLRGIIHCGHCGCSLTVSYTIRKGKMYRYYVCSTASKMGYDTCPVRTVSAGEIEQAVVGQLRVVFNSPEMVAQTYMQAKAFEVEEIERLQREKTEQELALLRLRERISDLAVSGRSDDYTRSEIRTLGNDVEEVQIRLITIGAELHVMESRRIIEDDVSQALKKLDPIWNELFPAEQRRIVQLLVEGVTVSTEGLDVRIRTDGLHSLVTELMDGNRSAEE
jgi:site-specific DNA recombinase